MIVLNAPNAVRIAQTGSATTSFQHERTVASPLTAVVERLRSAIEGAGLWVLHEIDPQALLRRDGYEIPGARQILFLHPRLMARLLEADSAAILEVPLKFALLEQLGDTRLRWLDPAQALAKYRNDSLDELGRDLTRLGAELADVAVADLPVRSPA